MGISRRAFMAGVTGAGVGLVAPGGSVLRANEAGAEFTSACCGG